MYSFVGLIHVVHFQKSELIDQATRVSTLRCCILSSMQEAKSGYQYTSTFREILYLHVNHLSREPSVVQVYTIGLQITHPFACLPLQCWVFMLPACFVHLFYVHGLKSRQAPYKFLSMQSHSSCCASKS